MVSVFLRRDFGLGHFSVKSSLLNSGSHLKLMDFFKHINAVTSKSPMFTQLEEIVRELNLLAWISMAINTTRTSNHFVHFPRIRSKSKEMG